MYNDYKNQFVTGKVIVALDRSIDSMNNPEYDLSLILSQINYEKVEIIFHSKNNLGDIILIHLKDKTHLAVIDAIETLSTNPFVVYAEPDYIEEIFKLSNDPLYRELWGTQKVKASSAWDYTTGSSDIVVGVIDTGIDYNHPDIRENMWISPNREIYYGWNFADNNENSIDLDGHGTHVAGTIGAVGNNGIGITGICWDVKVVSMKFGLDVASAIASIDFANEFHIPILNASWGGRAYSQALKYAIEQYEGLFIAAAGNDGTNNDYNPVYPASYDCQNIISVAATTPYDNLARFSNYGVRNVDIAAPGTGILSLDLYGDYSPLNGTSMAAPHVAGAAALLKSYMPNISSLELKNIILSTATPIPQFIGKVLTGGILDVKTMFAFASTFKQTNDYNFKTQ